MYRYFAAQSPRQVVATERYESRIYIYECSHMRAVLVWLDLASRLYGSARFVRRPREDKTETIRTIHSGFVFIILCRVVVGSLVNLVRQVNPSERNIYIYVRWQKSSNRMLHQRFVCMCVCCCFVGFFLHKAIYLCCGRRVFFFYIVDIMLYVRIVKLAPFLVRESFYIYRWDPACLSPRVLP